MLKSRSEKISKRFVYISVLTIIGFSIFVVYVSNFNAYTLHKIQYFLDTNEILEGSSSKFRLNSQEILIDAFLSNSDTVLFGNGWGQVTYYYGGKLWQAGGGELITTLAYGGFLSGITYIIYIFNSFTAAKKMELLYKGQKESVTYEGIMFAIVGSFITGQINGSLNAPEYWLLIGIAIYLGYRSVSFKKYQWLDRKILYKS